MDALPSPQSQKNTSCRLITRLDLDLFVNHRFDQMNNLFNDHAYSDISSLDLITKLSIDFLIHDKFRNRCEASSTYGKSPTANDLVFDDLEGAVRKWFFFIVSLSCSITIFGPDFA